MASSCTRGGRVRLRIKRNCFSQRVVMQWHSCPGSGGVTIPRGVPEPWRCGTKGHGQRAWWDELGLDLMVLEVFSNKYDRMILKSSIPTPVWISYCRLVLLLLSKLQEQHKKLKNTHNVRTPQLLQPHRMN